MTSTAPQTLYRHRLPQLTEPFVTDGGLETTLVFHQRLDLPHFAAVDLLRTSGGYAVLRDYYRTYAVLARRFRVGFLLETPTWRASRDWAEKLGYEESELERLNRLGVALLEDIRAELAGDSPSVISGCIGPRGDGYDPAEFMDAGEAARYHAEQIDVFRTTAADMISAITMTYAAEAIGITRAARAAGMPVAISFTVETDGRLPSGQSLADAILEVDRATGRGPAYYMINCAHPTHFEHLLSTPEPWMERIGGLRANASCKSHAELDESPELDEGHPRELGEQHRSLLEKLPNVRVLGGCCGTDHRHVFEICRACFEPVLARM